MIKRMFPHWCADGHIEIGHADSENELCPLCAVIAQRDALAAELEEAIANFADPKDKRRIRELETALREGAEYLHAFTPAGTAAVDAFIAKWSDRSAPETGAKHE
jgi:hypothetical protein